MFLRLELSYHFTNTSSTKLICDWCSILKDFTFKDMQMHLRLKCVHHSKSFCNPRMTYLSLFIKFTARPLTANYQVSFAIRGVLLSCFEYFKLAYVIRSLEE